VYFFDTLTRRREISDELLICKTDFKDALQIVRQIRTTMRRAQECNTNNVVANMMVLLAIIVSINESLSRLVCASKGEPLF
jgi:hypothetical protein